MHEAADFLCSLPVYSFFIGVNDIYSFGAARIITHVELLFINIRK